MIVGNEYGYHQNVRGKNYTTSSMTKVGTSFRIISRKYIRNGFKGGFLCAKRYWQLGNCVKKICWERKSVRLQKEYIGS